MPQTPTLHNWRFSLLRMVPAHQFSLLIQSLTWISVLAGLLSWHEGIAVLSGNLATLIALVLCPRCQLLGKNHTRLPAKHVALGAVALTFDDGPDPHVTPKVLDILERYGAHASFFCIGTEAARYPQLIDEMLRRGHSVENHTHAHPVTFAAFSPSAMLSEIENAQRILSRTGVPEPRYFRAPMGFRSPLLADVLRRLGMTHVAWTRRGLDRLLCNPHQVYRRLTTGLAAGDILLLHDCAGRNGAPAVVLEALPLLLDHLAENSLHAIALPPDLEESSAIPEQKPHIYS